MVPVVCSTVLDPTLVCTAVCPSLTMVMTVVVGVTSVDTRAFVVKLGVVAAFEDVFEAAGASVVVAATPDERWVCDVAAASDVDGASSDDEGSAGELDEAVDDGAAAVDEGVSSVDDGSSVVEGAADDEAPVPCAWRFSPWWR